jgi:hypothetical protein
MHAMGVYFLEDRVHQVFNKRPPLHHGDEEDDIEVAEEQP